ncbi:MAG: hypothetical protein R2751_18975 [Bacteroidales bacterium]
MEIIHLESRPFPTVCFLLGILVRFIVLRLVFDVFSIVHFAGITNTRGKQENASGLGQRMQTPGSFSSFRRKWQEEKTPIYHIAVLNIAGTSIGTISRTSLGDADYRQETRTGGICSIKEEGILS